jgi:hypothetical protein
MVACVLTGLGAARLVDLTTIAFLYRCRPHDTYYIVDHSHLPIVGAAAAIALLISAFVVERTATSDNWRIHSSYLLALLGFLLALAIWGLSAHSLLGLARLCT